eukprot:Pgem_evm1s4066
MLYASILFLSREGFRLAMLRADLSTQHKEKRKTAVQNLVNCAWVSVILSFVLSVL